MSEDIAGTPEPETSELLQEEAPMPVVPVEVRGTARVTVVPARGTESRLVNVPFARAEPVLAEDPRRQAVTFVVGSNWILLGPDRRAVEQGTAGIMVTDTPVRFETGCAWWARSTAAAGSTISYWTEQNAD